MLEQAGLLTTVKRGRVRECRVRECRLREDALVAVATWTTSMTATDPTPGARVRPVAPLLHAGLPAVLPAGVATTALAAAGRAAGISLDMAGEPIPVLGSSVPTVAFGLVGVLLAVARRLP